MKPKDELQPIIDAIASDKSPVGMDAVYVHALILDQLKDMSERLVSMEQRLKHLEEKGASGPETSS